MTKLEIELEKYIDDKFKASERALDLARKEIDRRLEQLNELRGEVTKDRDQYLRKDVYEIKMNDLQKWRDETNKNLTTINTRSITWNVALGIFFTILLIILKFVKLI